MTAMRLKRYPSQSGGFALGKMGVGATMLKQGKTARDYVQSGLVFMLDGIENAGWGVHNSTGGINLVTGTSVLSGATYSDDAIEMTTSSTALSIDMSAITSALLGSDGATIGLLGRDSSVMTSTEIRGFLRTPNDAIFQFGGQRSSNGNGTWQSIVNWKGRRNTLSSGYYVNQGTRPFVYRTVLTYAPQSLETKMYINGVMKASTTASTYDWTSLLPSLRLRPVDFGMMNLVCYNRILTADEIAANYAIDKERFNLP